MSATTERLPDSSLKARPSGPISFEEFLAWLDEDTPAEWVDGEVVLMSPASDEHQLIKIFLVQVIGIFVESGRLGRVLDAPFVMKTMVRPSGREPDMLFVSQERLALIQPTYLDGPADLVVEIISLESIGRDRGEKFVEYEAAGVREYWLIDPLRQQAEFYQLGADQRYRAMVSGSDGIYHSMVLGGLWLKIDWLWQRPLPPVLGVLKELGVL